MLRAYVENWDGGFELPDFSREEVHHLVRVRRARIGECVQILNGRGHLGRGRILEVDAKEVRIALDAIQVVDPPKPGVTLLVGMPKGKVFPSLLHRAVELGVSEIVPLITDNSEVSSDRGEGKLERWQTVLVEALKQSGNPHLPRLHRPLSMVEAMEMTAGSVRLVLALVNDATPIQHLSGSVYHGSSQLALFVGPEGDFSEREYALLRAGSHFLSLGPLVLKVETAAVVALGILKMYPSARALYA